MTVIIHTHEIGIHDLDGWKHSRQQQPQRSVNERNAVVYQNNLPYYPIFTHSTTS